MKLVRQEHKGGCSIATLAMLTGTTYGEARERGRAHGVKHNGTSRPALKRALAAQGLRTIEVAHPYLRRVSGDFPRGYAEVRWPSNKKYCWHTVALDERRRVLDPQDRTVTRSLTTYLKRYGGQVLRIVKVY